MFRASETKNMIRTPEPRDLFLIQKLQGLVLPPEEALINAYSPLRVALLGPLNPLRSGFCQTITYVLSQQEDQISELRSLFELPAVMALQAGKRYVPFRLQHRRSGKAKSRLNGEIQ